MTINLLSPTANELVTSQTGYRNDDLSAGVFKITDIIEFETNELGNTDIHDTCAKLYNTTPRNSMQDAFRTTDLYGLWVTTKSGVTNHYSDEQDSPITAYNIPENAHIVSDLDTEGVLFVFIPHPNQLKQE